MTAPTFLRGFSVNAVAAGATFGIAFVNQALIARGLGPHGRGQLALVATSVALGGLLFGEWLARGSSYHAGRQPHSVGPVWHNAVRYSVALLVLLLAAAWAGQRLAGDSVDLAAPQWLLAAGLVALFVAQKSFTAVLQGRDRLTAYALVPLLFTGTYLALNGVGLLWLGAGLDGVLVAWLAALATSALVAGGLTAAPGGPDAGLLRSTLQVGGRGAVSGTLIYLMFRSDIYLVGVYAGTEALGVYAIAVVIAEMMQRGPNIAGAVMLPKVLRGIDDDHQMSLAVGRWVLLFSLLAAAAVVLAGGPLIAWAFGAPYAGAHAPLVWMLPGLVASGFASVLNTKLAGEGYPPVTMWAPGVALAVNVGLNLWLIPRLGLLGAALSTSVAYTLWAMIVTVAYRQRTGVAWARFARAAR